MSNHITLDVEVLKSSIFQAIQQSKLPVGVVKLVLESVLAQVDSLVNERLNTELQEQQKEKEKTTETIQDQTGKTITSFENTQGND